MILLQDFQPVGPEKFTGANDPWHALKEIGGLADFWFFDDGDILCHPVQVLPCLQAFDTANAKVGMTFQLCKQRGRAATDSKCQQVPSTTDGNTIFKLGSKDAGSPAQHISARTVAFGQTYRQRTNHWARAPPMDGGGDEDADTGTDTTVPDDDIDDIVSCAGQQTSAIEIHHARAIL